MTSLLYNNSDGTVTKYVIVYISLLVCTTIINSISCRNMTSCSLLCLSLFIFINWHIWPSLVYHNTGIGKYIIRVVTSQEKHVTYKHLPVHCCTIQWHIRPTVMGRMLLWRAAGLKHAVGVVPLGTNNILAPSTLKYWYFLVAY